DELAAAGNTGEVESPAEGELVAATLAEVVDSVEAVEAEPTEEDSEAATEEAATEEAPEDNPQEAAEDKKSCRKRDHEIEVGRQCPGSPLGLRLSVGKQKRG